MWSKAELAVIVQSIIMTGDPIRFNILEKEVFEQKLYLDFTKVGNDTGKFQLESYTDITFLWKIVFSIPIPFDKFVIEMRSPIKDAWESYVDDRRPGCNIEPRSLFGEARVAYASFADPQAIIILSSDGDSSLISRTAIAVKLID